MDIRVHLDGGGLRGFCHFTVLDTLRKFTNITSISGYSIGSLVGFIGCFKHVDLPKAQRVFYDMYPSSLLDEPMADALGLFANLRRNKSLCEISYLKGFVTSLCDKLGISGVNKMTLRDVFDKTGISLKIVTSNIIDYVPVVHTKETNQLDCVLDLVTSSMAYPGVFPPVRLKIDNGYHYDGGTLGGYIDPHCVDNSCKIPIVSVRFTHLNNKIPVVTHEQIQSFRQDEFMIKKTTDWKKISPSALLKHITHNTSKLFSRLHANNSVNDPIRFYLEIVVPKDYTVFSTAGSLSDNDRDISIHNTMVATSAFVAKMILCPELFFP